MNKINPYTADKLTAHAANIRDLAAWAEGQSISPIIGVDIVTTVESARIAAAFLEATAEALRGQAKLRRERAVADIIERKRRRKVRRPR